ncbi:MAG: hypothetical protein K2Y15_09335 [Burkholderiaceae bacterium]|nr:hypothetical protein [Burkholderiaceae bacterium]
MDLAARQKALRIMKSLHVLGISCLAIAVLCYVVAAATIAGGVFTFFGFVFELIAFGIAKRIPDDSKKESLQPSIKIPRSRR